LNLLESLFFCGFPASTARTKMAQTLRSKILKPETEKVDEFETSIAQVCLFSAMIFLGRCLSNHCIPLIGTLGFGNEQ